MRVMPFPTFRSPFKSGSALASRLCKAAMLHRFKLLAKETQREDLLATSTYKEAKVMKTLVSLLMPSSLTAQDNRSVAVGL